MATAIRLVDISNGNNLSNRQVNSSIVLWGTPSRIGIEIAHTGETKYSYRSNVRESGDRGYEDYIDNDFNDAVIRLTSVSCPEGVSRPRQVSSPPRQPTPPRAEQANTVPSIQSVSVGNIGQTSAEATINIADSDGSTQTAKLQYRATSPQGQWSTPALEATSTGATAQIDLSGLTADTAYEVQAWLAGDETDKKTSTFRTLQGSQLGTRSLSQSVSSQSVKGVTFGNIAQTSADVTVNIRNPGTSQKTVRLHYRADGTKKWSTVIAKETSSSSVTISLIGLTAETTYEVQAWLDSSSPPSGTWIYSFDTLEEVPSISGLRFEDVGQTSATARVEIEGGGAEMKRVFLRYRVQGEDDWTLLPFSTITYGSDVPIHLSGLKEQTTYEVSVVLSIDFNAMLVRSFTTLSPVPVVSGVSIDDETQTTATANISSS